MANKDWACLESVRMLIKTLSTQRIPQVTRETTTPWCCKYWTNLSSLGLWVNRKVHERFRSIVDVAQSDRIDFIGQIYSLSLIYMSYVVEWHLTYLYLPPAHLQHLWEWSSANSRSPSLWNEYTTNFSAGSVISLLTGSSWDPARSQTAAAQIRLYVLRSHRASRVCCHHECGVKPHRPCCGLTASCVSNSL